MKSLKLTEVKKISGGCKCYCRCTGKSGGKSGDANMGEVGEKGNCFRTCRDMSWDLQHCDFLHCV